VVHHPPLASRGELAAEFSPDGRQLAVSLVDGTVAVYAADGWREAARLKTGFSKASLAFHPDGTRLAVADNTGTGVQVWAIGPGQLLRQVSAPAGEEPRPRAMYAVGWHPAGTLLAAGNQNGNAYLWDAATGRHHATLRGHGAAVAGTRRPAGTTRLSGGTGARSSG
jgi:WD40 repeat protein